jgi:dipeptidyl aminopeptidase/acylaminoacyl peptidase
MAHGGPTSRSDDIFDWKVQFWTSRGFAVFDVNYRGSTGVYVRMCISLYDHAAGFGRTYRDLLYGHCGEMDIDDCAAAARYLVSSGRVDAARLCIVGQSAGGYAVLCSVLRPNLFSVGEQQRTVVASNVTCVQPSRTMASASWRR